METSKKPLNTPGIQLRKPVPEDGADVFELVQQSPPLDPNSMYCNLLQATHFADTSVSATFDGQLVGFISGYLLPTQPQTLFIWQVAVAESARGQGLASRMLDNILQRPYCSQVSYLETTITENNAASWRLFTALAERLTTEINASVMFERQQHFQGQHDTEMLARVGPFQVAPPSNT